MMESLSIVTFLVLIFITSSITAIIHYCIYKYEAYNKFYKNSWKVLGIVSAFSALSIVAWFEIFGRSAIS